MRGGAHLRTEQRRRRRALCAASERAAGGLGAPAAGAGPRGGGLIPDPKTDAAFSGDAELCH